MEPTNYIRTDYLVIGSGLAGMRAALELSSRGYQVALVTKKTLYNGSSSLAQGGIAAVHPQRMHAGEDSFGLHLEDTLNAADGIGDFPVTEEFTRRAYRDVIHYLMKSGVSFSQIEGGYVLHQEGGHSRPRIYCVGDYTGKAVVDTLVERIREDPNITVYEHHSAIDLITVRKLQPHATSDACLGAYVYGDDCVKTFDADSTFVATGGAGRIYLFTSNDEVSTGDGIAMAYRAGAPVANMEFTQFHPTVLYGYNEHGRSFLITEALRGKTVGGILTREEAGEGARVDFVKSYTPDGSSGTRDVVARAIDTEMKQNGLSHVFLNVTPAVTGKAPEEIQNAFPKIHEKLISLGWDMTKQSIPVVPASHYTCGGVLVGRHGEVPAINRLYVIGEASCTGLMGANRLASNSLPEAALYGLLAVDHATKKYRGIHQNLPLWDVGQATKSRRANLVHFYWDEVRNLMWHLVGIVREEEGLIQAKKRIDLIEEEINDYYWSYEITPDFLELRNIAQVADLTIKAARWREESRGGHFRSDFPQKDDDLFLKPSVQMISRRD